jgi:hypothetical protein
MDLYSHHSPRCLEEAVPSAAEVDLGVPLTSARRRLEVEAGAAFGKSGFGSEVEFEAGVVLAGAAVDRSRSGSEVEVVTEALAGRRLPPTEVVPVATTACSAGEITSVGLAVAPALYRIQGER